MKNSLEQSLPRAVAFLSKEQKSDGSFLLLYSPSPNDFSKAIPNRSVFATAMILNSLNTMNDPELSGIKQKAAQFLLSQKSKHWSWNYWVRQSEESKTTPYPDDLDDTALCLAALYGKDPKLVNGEALAAFVELLTTLEVNEGGPYKTWLVENSAPLVWKDVDVAVNANIGFLLSLLDIELPNIYTFMKQAIKKRTVQSPYYYGELPVWYFISRWYSLKRDVGIKNMDLGREGTALEMALKMLINRDDGMEVLLSQQQSDGSWPAGALLLGKTEKEGAWFAGSKAVTTALCVEAISRMSKVESRKSPMAIHNKVLDVGDLVIKEVRKRFGLLKNPLRKTSLAALKRVLDFDHDQQIVLLPFLFAKMLKLEFSAEIQPSLLIALGKANLYGWIAYTIYDDFFDSEPNLSFLSVANLCLREMTGIFETVLPNNPEFLATYRSILDTIDEANTWEVINTRFDVKKGKLHPNPPLGKGRGLSIPDYGDLSQLAEKSLGHALGPVAILFALGKNKKDPDIKYLLKFFHHYLIARQLNDDAHDWEQDLKMGQINAVGARILRQSYKLQATSYKFTLDGKNKKQWERLKELFWEEIIPSVCEDIFHHTKLARAAAKKISVLATTQPFENILQKLDASAEKTLTERKKAKEFLKKYTGI